MAKFTIADKTAVTTVDADNDAFPVWHAGAQYKASARKIVNSVPMVGDTGTGGEAGILPTPPAGSGAAHKLFSADGTWRNPAQPAGVTVTVKTSGGDYTSITAAIADLEQQYVSPQNGNGDVGTSAFVDIVVSDGIWNLANSISGGRNCYLRIEGEHYYDKAMSSVVSSVGASGAWVITLALNNVSNIAIGDYVLIHTPSGGTHPTFIAGCWPVTNIDTGNSRITITTTHRHASAPSGAISATVRVIKTILTVPSGYDCVRAWDQSFLVMSNIVLKGFSGALNGLSVQDSSRVYLGPVGITGFTNAIYTLYCSEVNSDYPACLSDNSNGIYADANSCVYSTNLIATGNYSGLYVFHSSMVSAQGGILSGNVNGCNAETLGCVDVSNGYVTGNTIGYNVDKCGYVYDGSTTYNDNGSIMGSYRFRIDGLTSVDGLVSTAPIRFTPGASADPWSNGQVSFETPDNTHVVIKFKGSDGTTRSYSITVA